MQCSSFTGSPLGLKHSRTVQEPSTSTSSLEHETGDFRKILIKARFVEARSEVQDVKNSTVALVAELKQCGNRKDLQRGKLLHSKAVETGVHTNIYVSNTLISMYSKCGSFLQARRVFDSMIHRSVVSWNNLMLGYVDNGESLVALEMLDRMDCPPDSVTFVAAIKACAALAAGSRVDNAVCLEKGVALHRKAMELSLEKDILVASTLVDMYSKCGDMLAARTVFDGMAYRSVVTWTTLMVGYVENGESLAAWDVFSSMDCAPDRVAFVAALKACASLAAGSKSDKELCLLKGTPVHRRARELGFEKELSVANTLVDMYCKCGDMTQARCVFDQMTHRDVVSWSALITGYVENGESVKALETFNIMESSPNRVTYVAAIKACGCLGALDIGLGLHEQVCKLGIEQDDMAASSLVDFYGKCGKMEAAERVFDQMQSLDTVAWNSLISGYSSLGETLQVLRTVGRMQDCGVQPDGVTMLLILTACNHAGMVEQGERCVRSMSSYKNIRLTPEHYTCMVDMLGRVNRLEEALSLVRELPVAANTSAWITLLGTCRKLGNLEIGKLAFSELEIKDKNRMERESHGAQHWLTMP